MHLSQDPEPPGTDGFYYVVQVEHLLRDGALHVPDASWVLYFLAAAAWLAGDPIVGVKAGSCALAALCVPAGWLAGKRIGGAWFLAAWAAASPTLTHLAGDFPKNLGMAAPLLLVASGGPVGVLGALLAATAHRMGAALLLLGALGWFLGRRSPRALLVGIAFV